MPLTTIQHIDDYYRYGPVIDFSNNNGTIFISFVGDSNLIKVSKVHQKGYGVVATKDISAASQICSITRPLLVALDTPRLKDTCYACFQQAKDKHELAFKQNRTTDGEEKSLKVCTGCRVVRFCDTVGLCLVSCHSTDPLKDCQSQAWKLYHKHECPIFKALYPRVLPNNVRAVVRFLLQKKYHGLYPTMWEHVQDLEDHIDELRNAGGSRWENLIIMAQGAKEYSRTDQDFITILKLFCRLMVNGMTLTTTWGDPIGLFLHPMLSRINHGCNPNAFIHMRSIYTRSNSWAPGTLKLVPLRKIKAGEQILIAYIDSNDHVDSRQKQLREQYFFTCNCNKCKEELASNSGLLSTLTQPQLNAVKQTRDKALSCIESADVATSTSKKIEFLRYAIHLMQQTECWPLDMDPYPKAQHQLILAYIESSRFDYALSHAAVQHFDIDPLVYADYTVHPTRNIHTFLLIRLITLLVEGDKWSSQTMGLEKYGLNLRWWRAKLRKELVAEFRKTSVFHDIAEAVEREHEGGVSGRVVEAELEDVEKQEKAMQGMRKVIEEAYEQNRRWDTAV